MPAAAPCTHAAYSVGPHARWDPEGPLICSFWLDASCHRGTFKADKVPSPPFPGPPVPSPLSLPPSTLLPNAVCMCVRYVVCAVARVMLSSRACMYCQVLSHLTSPDREWHQSILCCYWLQYQLHRQLKQVRPQQHNILCCNKRHGVV